jgi:drug/metabolite transporter (DMT)-like permease
VFSVKVFDLKWEARKLSAVLLATAGVVAVVYGGSTSDKSTTAKAPASPSEPSMPLIGDLLTFVASVGYAVYQVLYKKYAALEESSDTVDEHYEPLPDIEHPAPAENTLPPLPYGLYSNMLTSTIGFGTMVLLWIPLPLLHWFDIEPFSLPQDYKTIATILGIILSGAIFNAGFMVGFSSVRVVLLLKCRHIDTLGNFGSHHNICWRIINHCTRIHL